MKLYETELFYEKDLILAAEYLLSGEVIAFPTETVYGLGACIFNEEAIRKIFTIKGRPSDNPLIAHISELSFVERIAQDISPLFYRLAEKFFPGPLTIILPKSSEVPSIASAGLQTIAVRMPNHPIALKLIELVGQPIVAPSANLSGKPSATDFKHVLEDFEGVIPGVVVGHSSSIGIESTVIRLLKEKVEIVRPGAIFKEHLEDFLKEPVFLYQAKPGEKVPSPGMKYRHYAPKAKVTLFFTVEDAAKHLIKQSSIERMLLCNEPICSMVGVLSLPLSCNSFYSNLRLADRLEIGEVVIVCDGTIQKDLGLMNRIEKSSGA
ncbi:MAG: L-threonylcarbamoyladenylate synthase [Chlamydiota bacterium]